MTINERYAYGCGCVHGAESGLYNETDVSYWQGFCDALFPYTDIYWDEEAQDFKKKITVSADGAVEEE